MPAISTFFIAPRAISYEDHVFSLDISRGRTKTTICMSLYTPVVNTRHIPTVYAVLKKLLPTVLSSKCFNEDNLPFAMEVRQTEIGHLFEHILLEYLCEAKLALGCDTAIYSGSTSWNWHKNPKGTFHITITSGAKDSQFFEEALIKTIQLTKFLLQGTRIQKGIIPPFHTLPVALKNGTSNLIAKR